MTKTKNRQDALDKLLKPITWDWSTSVEYRRRLVQNRHAEVRIVIPFLTKAEAARVKKWQKEESHSALWD